MLLCAFLFSMNLKSRTSPDFGQLNFWTNFVRNFDRPRGFDVNVPQREFGWWSGKNNLACYLPLQGSHLFRNSYKNSHPPPTRTTTLAPWIRTKRISLESPNMYFPFANRMIWKRLRQLQFCDSRRICRKRNLKPVSVSTKKVFLPWNIFLSLFCGNFCYLGCSNLCLDRPAERTTFLLHWCFNQETGVYLRMPKH